jgi:large subunit ribosomal protein L4
MATLDVQKLGKGTGGKVDLDPAVFEARVRPHLFHAEVRRQLAARRAGTHSTKNRSAVSGGGAKPYRQKGTGRARQGTIRAPQWAGGGAVFGPVPRSYEHALTKKMRRAALCGALSQRLAEGAVTVVDGLEVESGKTRDLVAQLQDLGVADRSVLIVLGEPDERLERSARNLPWAKAIRAGGLNVYDVLRHSQLLMTQAGLEAVQARLGGAGGGASS